MMSRSIVASVVAFAFGVLPVVHDACGPDCAMGDAPIIVAVTADEPAEAECPLHPAENEAPVHHTDGCTHDHGIMRDAPHSASALAAAVSQPLQLPVAAFAAAAPDVVMHLVARRVVSPPIDRTPTLLSLRI